MPLEFQRESAVWKAHPPPPIDRLTPARVAGGDQPISAGRLADLSNHANHTHQPGEMSASGRSSGRSHGLTREHNREVNDEFVFGVGKKPVPETGGLLHAGLVQVEERSNPWK